MDKTELQIWKYIQIYTVMWIRYRLKNGSIIYIHSIGWTFKNQKYNARKWNLLLIKMDKYKNNSLLLLILTFFFLR